MTCHEALNNLDDYLEGVLPAAEASAIKQHLEGCEACQHQANAAEWLGRELKALPRELAPGAVVWERVAAATLGLDSRQEEGERVSDSYIVLLSEAVAVRLGERAQELLAKYIPCLDRLSVADRNTARLLTYVAITIDMGFYQTHVAGYSMTHLEQLKKALFRIPRSARATLPAETVARLRFCEGAVTLMEEKFDAAVEDLQLVGLLESELADRDLVAVARWFLARAHIRRGEYKVAREYLNQAEELANVLHRTELLAVIQARKGWLVFQEGDYPEANRFFETAAPILKVVEDHRSLGFIEQALGRMAKREGRYGAAVDHYDKALGEFRDRANPLGNNSGLEGLEENADQAQTRVNIAFVRYLLSRRYGPSDPERGRLRSAAADALDRAEATFRRLNHPVGSARVHLMRAFLHIQVRDWYAAESETNEAYAIGRRYKHPLLLARACILRCKIEYLLEDHDTEAAPGYHSQKALEAVDEATKHASQTQNQRLVAKAWIWQGLTLLRKHFNRVSEAHECYLKAEKYLRPRGADNVTDHFNLLAERLQRVLPGVLGNIAIPQPAAATGPALEEIA
jgi:tetratricopeptide (TPR) repeat protein